MLNDIRQRRLAVLVIYLMFIAWSGIRISISRAKKPKQTRVLCKGRIDEAIVEFERTVMSLHDAEQLTISGSTEKLKITNSQFTVQWTDGVVWKFKVVFFFLK